MFTETIPVAIKIDLLNYLLIIGAGTGACTGACTVSVREEEDGRGISVREEG
jgi:hypothetical protein